MDASMLSTLKRPQCTYGSKFSKCSIRTSCSLMATQNYYIANSTRHNYAKQKNANTFEQKWKIIGISLCSALFCIVQTYYQCYVLLPKTKHYSQTRSSHPISIQRCGRSSLTRPKLPPSNNFYPPKGFKGTAILFHSSFAARVKVAQILRAYTLESLGERGE